MIKTLQAWIHRHPVRVTTWLVVLLLAVVVTEGFLLLAQRKAIRSTEVQSAKLLTTFLKGDTAQASGAYGVPIRMQNVRFKWSDKVYIDTGNMAVRAVPVEGSTVDFDDPNSFRLKLQQSTVELTPSVLEGMFNESVFNYPDSKLRDLTVKITNEDNVRAVRVAGMVNLGVWIPFAMSTQLSIDTQTNTLVIDVKHIKVMGILSATKLIKWKPLHLENLIALPPNKSLIVDVNRLMVKPFALFPPPRVEGTMSKVTVDDKAIRLTFAGSAIPAPESSAKNYVYLRGGTSQFGSFRMFDTNVLVLDQDPSDPFGFSLVHYADMVAKSRIEIHDTHSARVTMPDY